MSSFVALEIFRHHVRESSDAYGPDPGIHALIIFWKPLTSAFRFLKSEIDKDFRKKRGEQAESEHDP